MQCRLKESKTINRHVLIWQFWIHSFCVWARLEWEDAPFVFTFLEMLPGSVQKTMTMLMETDNWEFHSLMGYETRALKWIRQFVLLYHYHHPSQEPHKHRPQRDGTKPGAAWRGVWRMADQRREVPLGQRKGHLDLIIRVLQLVLFHVVSAKLKW